MLAPGLGGGWKKPVQGWGGGDVGSCPQAAISCSAAAKRAAELGRCQTRSSLRRVTLVMIPVAPKELGP